MFRPLCPWPASRSPSSARCSTPRPRPLFDSQRAGMATIVLVWTAGALLLATVPAPKGPRPEAPKAVVAGRGEWGGEDGY